MLGFTKVQAQEFPMQGQGRPSLNLHQEWMFGKSHCNEAFFYILYLHMIQLKGNWDVQEPWQNSNCE